jgi:hypothetical protein
VRGEEVYSSQFRRKRRGTVTQREFTVDSRQFAVSEEEKREKKKSNAEALRTQRFAEKRNPRPTRKPGVWGTRRNTEITEGPQSSQRRRTQDPPSKNEDGAPGRRGVWGTRRKAEDLHGVH